MSTNYEWLDLIPPGWGELARKMIEECEAVDPSYEIDDLKEKWGRLNIFSHYHIENDDLISEIENKYEKLSAQTCCGCSKSATKISTGWILPWCDECGTNEEKYYKRFKDE